MSDLEKNWRALLVFMEQLCHAMDIDPDTTDIRVNARKFGGDARELACLNLGDILRDGAALRTRLDPE